MLSPRMAVTTRHEPSACPECGHVLSASTAVYSDVRPKPGDVSVCIKCAALLQFRDDLSFELADTTKLPLDVLEQLAEAQTAVKKLHRQEGNANA